MPIKQIHLKEALIELLSKEQTAEGGFRESLFDSPDCEREVGACASPLSTALILYILSRADQNDLINSIKQKAIEYLTSQKDKNWLFPPEIKYNQEKTFLIDELLVLFPFLSALKKSNPELINGSDLAKILKILTDREVDEGGPYKSSFENSEVVDLAANCHIANFLSLEEVSLPKLDSLIETACQTGRLESNHYYSTLLLADLIADFSPDCAQTFANTLNHQSADPVDQILLYLIEKKSSPDKNSSRHLPENKTEILKPKAMLRYTADDCKDLFGYSPALAAALAINAIDLESRPTDSVSENSNEKNDHIHSLIIAGVEKRFENLDTDLKNRSMAALNNITVNDTNREVVLLPAFFSDCLAREEKEKIPENLLVDLGMANVYLWITFKLYDDFLDEEGDPRTLPTANVCLREYVRIYDNLFPRESSFHKLFQDLMDTLEAANAWETANCRASLAGFHLEIPETLPDYGDYDRLCDRSYAHGLGPVAILFFLGYDKDSREVLSLIEFFRNYLKGRQLNDDLHDWEKDLKNGHIDGVVASLLEGRQGDLIDLRNDDYINKMKKIFWFEIMPRIAAIALDHINEAKSILKSIPVLADPSYLENLLAPWEQSSRLALKEHKESVEFLNNFDDNSGEVVLVDEHDNPIGVANKYQAHFSGDLHRAFSIFVFNSKNELMLQKRSSGKYHCGGLWTNTCCSHPRPGEELETAAHRRLREEMGFDCELEKIFDFIYKVKLDSGLTENEFDHVFIGRYENAPELNPKEAEDWKWISLDELEKDIAKNPEKYTPWFKIALPRVKEFIIKYRE